MTKILEMAKNKKYIAIAVLILIIGGYYWYSKSKSGTGQMQYVTATVEKGTITTSVSGSGNVIVDQSSNVEPTITGTVANLAVNVGDKVTKGQLLFNIVNNDLSVSAAKSLTSYQQALSSLESAKANKKQAKQDLNNNTGGAEGKITLKQKLEASEASVVSAEQGVISARADLANQRSNATERNVTSPIDGTVNAVNIKNGDDLSKLASGSSRTVPIIIGDLSTMKAQVQVNEVDIPNVTIGQKAMMTFSAIDGLEVSGEVEKMDSIGTLASGVVTYNVTIDFDTLDPRIKPEMSVSANIITDVKQNVIVISNSAVKTQNGSSYVEVLNSGNTPVQANIQTGASNNTDTEITSGINVGDKVVTQTISPTTSTSATSSSSSRSSGSSSNVRIPGVGSLGR
jgi:HlyD family secretion protein